MRKAIVNGPDIHPGATRYEDKNSTTQLRLSVKRRITISRKLPSSKATEVRRNSDNEFEGKIVYRHLRDGDIVLVNRQVIFTFNLICCLF